MTSQNSYNSANWSLYQTFRPKYPESLYEMILSWHRDHGGEFNAYHDIGTGAGIVSKELVSLFDKVYLSDPSEHNISEARKRVKEVYGNDSRFNLSATPAEEEWLPPASVDLITICEAAHWMNIDVAIEQAARTLKPGGTLAMVYYSARPMIADNPRAEAAWCRIMDYMAEWVYNNKESALPGKRSWEQGDAGLDFVPLSTSLFEPGARRKYIHSHRRSEKFPFTKSERSVEKGLFKPAESRVTSDDVIEIADDKSWSMEIEGGIAWFKGLLDTMHQGLDLEAPELQSLWKELDEAINQDGRNDRTTLLWLVSIVLATRKK